MLALGSAGQLLQLALPRAVQSAAGPAAALLLSAAAEAAAAAERAHKAHTLKALVQTLFTQLSSGCGSSSCSSQECASGRSAAGLQALLPNAAAARAIELAQQLQQRQLQAAAGAARAEAEPLQRHWPFCARE